MKKILFLLAFLTSLLCCAEDAEFVSLSPGLTELICHLGLGGRLIGRSSVCDFPPEVRSVPVAGDYAKANPEWLAVQKRKHPGLILVADELYPPETEAVLRKLGIPLKKMPCRTIEDYCAWVRALGDMTSSGEAADRELERIRAAREKIRRDRPARGKSTVWILGTDPMVIAGPGSLPDSILKEIGAVNAAGHQEKPYFRASLEWLLLTDPDRIILLKRHGSDTSGSLTRHPVWNRLKAVRNGCVIRDISEDELLRPGPRLFDGMRKLQDAVGR